MCWVDLGMKLWFFSGGCGYIGNPILGFEGNFEGIRVLKVGILWKLGL